MVIIAVYVLLWVWVGDCWVIFCNCQIRLPAICPAHLPWHPLNFPFKITEMRSVAITIAIQMQFIMFCCVKLHFRKNDTSSSSIIISEQIYSSNRPRTTRNVMILANLSHCALCSLYLLLTPPLDALFQQEYLCCVRIRDSSLVFALTHISSLNRTWCFWSRRTFQY